MEPLADVRMAHMYETRLKPTCTADQKGSATSPFLSMDTLILRLERTVALGITRRKCQCWTEGTGRPACQVEAEQTKQRI